MENEGQGVATGIEDTRLVIDYLDLHAIVLVGTGQILGLLLALARYIEQVAAAALGNITRVADGSRLVIFLFGTGSRCQKHGTEANQGANAHEQKLGPKTNSRRAELQVG